MTLNDVVVAGAVFLLAVVAAWLWFGPAGRSSGAGDSGARGPGAMDVILSVVIVVVVLASGAMVVHRSMVVEPRSGDRMRAIEDLAEVREIEQTLDAYQRAVDSQLAERIAPLLCAADGDRTDLATEPPYLRGTLRSALAGQTFVVGAADRLGAAARVDVHQQNYPVAADPGVMYLVEAASHDEEGPTWLVCPSMEARFQEIE